MSCEITNYITGLILKYACLWNHCVTVFITAIQHFYYHDYKSICHLLLKSKWVSPGLTTTTRHRPTHGTVRKRQRTITDTWHPEDNKSQATSSLFHSGIIAKLAKQERAQSNAYQNKDQTQQTETLGAAANNSRTTVLERTPAEATVWGELEFIQVTKSDRHEIGTFNPLYTGNPSKTGTCQTVNPYEMPQNDILHQQSSQQTENNLWHI